ncbi:MAG: hypothetical protein PHW64_04820 [Sulfuricurvum sp.]|nr:hypothetical protein [Sulfuricurvum sp.]
MISDLSFGGTSPSPGIPNLCKRSYFHSTTPLLLPLSSLRERIYTGISDDYPRFL